jgi:toxin ParE1/3/4
LWFSKRLKKIFFAIYRYIADHDSQARATKLLQGLEQAFKSLATLPQRGHHPAELERIAVWDYLEIHHKPYRLIYQIEAKTRLYSCST